MSLLEGFCDLAHAYYADTLRAIVRPVITKYELTSTDVFFITFYSPISLGTPSSTS